MRILLLTHTFNSLAQKIYAELKRQGHTLTVEYDISDQVTESAVLKFHPDLIIAPFLKRAIPEQVWKKVLSLIVHPGPPGDRGPASLDWAILNEEKNWGVTIIEASSVLDGGDIWAFDTFVMRAEKKGSLYRQEVAAGALKSLREALTHIEDFKKGQWSPIPATHFKVIERSFVKRSDRRINWIADSRECIIKKINSADGSPGLLSELAGRKLYLYDAKIFPFEIEGATGIPLAMSDHGVIINTIDGPLAIGHLREKTTLENPTFKKAAHHYFSSMDLPTIAHPRVRLETIEDSVWIIFNFYNGAMGIKECRDLLQAFKLAKTTSATTIVLKSESGFFSNGIHLNEIEAAKIPADYAWENINAMNDLVEEIIQSVEVATVALVESSASAGGILLARACDLVIGNAQVILNPHYKNMGNLYGSEFWTYLFPKYLGIDQTREMMAKRIPMEAQEAKDLGLFDIIATPEQYPQIIQAAVTSIKELKKISRQKDEEKKPLVNYREEELAKMKQNFYGFDPSFHVARYNFVRHVVKSKTPLHIAVHRLSGPVFGSKV